LKFGEQNIYVYFTTRVVRNNNMNIKVRDRQKETKGRERETQILTDKTDRQKYECATGLTLRYITGNGDEN